MHLFEREVLISNSFLSKSKRNIGLQKFLSSAEVDKKDSIKTRIKFS